MRAIYRKIRHARYLYIKRNVEKVWGARYTLGARYLSKNTVNKDLVKSATDRLLGLWDRFPPMAWLFILVNVVCCADVPSHPRYQSQFHPIHDTSQQQYRLTIPEAECTVICS